MTLIGSACVRSIIVLRSATVPPHYVSGPSAPDKKNVHQRQLADFGMQRLHVDRRLCRFAMAVRSENPGSAFQQLPPPGRDLVRVNVKLLCQLGQRLLAPHGSQCHLRLESRTMVPACSLRHLISCSAAILAAFRQKLHLAYCAD